MVFSCRYKILFVPFIRRILGVGRSCYTHCCSETFGLLKDPSKYSTTFPLLWRTLPLDAYQVLGEPRKFLDPKPLQLFQQCWNNSIHAVRTSHVRVNFFHVQKLIHSLFLPWLGPFNQDLTEGLQHLGIDHLSSQQRFLERPLFGKVILDPDQDFHLFPLQRKRTPTSSL